MAKELHIRSNWHDGRGVSGRCESCGLAYEVVSIRENEIDLDCPDCGGPVYAIDEEAPGDLTDLIEHCPHCRVEAGDVCVWHDGFGAGWDACAAWMAGCVGAVEQAE